MKKKFQLACACGALIASLTAAVTLAACGDDGELKILTPSDGADNVSTCPEITWAAEENATLYHVEIASDGDYENVVREGKTAELSYTVGNALAHATQYYLRVTALKEESDKTIALSGAEISFKTTAAHDTTAPDYAAARTLYDFESFANGAALREEFSAHPDGNEVGVNLVNEGVNGSKAMEIDYTAGGRGWAGVLCKLPAEKKVWSGAKGIRMYVKGDGRGMNIEVRVGKRGYQSWAATFSVNNSQGAYVSIPFSAFDDIGGGDGIWDLAGITRFWLFFTGGSNSRVVIDNITIGSDENYTTDNRSEIETSYAAPAGVYDNFDGYADDDEMEENWTFEGMGSYTLTGSPFSAGNALELSPQSAWATARLSLPNYDFTQIESIRFKASAGNYVIQLETSSGGVFEKENIIVAVSGDEAGVNITDLVPRAGTEGGVRLISQLVIGVKNKNSMSVYVDDVTFSDEPFNGKDYTPEIGVADAFEYEDDDAMERVWSFESMGNYTLTESPFSAGNALELTPNSGWATARRNYPNVSFRGVTSIYLKASAGTYAIQLETKEGGVLEKDNLIVAGDGDLLGVNLSDLVLRAGTQGSLASIRCLVIGFIDANGKTCVLDDLTFSDEEFVPEDSTPTAGLIEDFETLTAENVSSFATVNGATLSLETDAPLSGTKSAKFTANGSFDFEVNNAYLAKYDFTKTIGFELAIKARSNAGNPAIIIQIGSYMNVYTITRPVYGSASNNIEKIVVPYDAMSLAEGSAGALNKANINYLRVFVTQYDSNFTLLVDDVKFFTADNYTPETVTIDDFSSYADDAAVSAAWHPNGCSVALDDGAMKVTTASGWNGLQYNFAAAGALGSDDDFQNCYAISFDVTASVNLDLTVKLQRWSNAKEAAVSVNGGETTHVVIYLNKLTGENDWSDMIFNYLTIGWTYYGVADVTFDNVAFLRG